MVKILCTHQIQSLQDIINDLEKDASRLWPILNPNVQQLNGDILQIETKQPLIDATDWDEHSFVQISELFVNVHDRTMMTFPESQFAALSTENKKKCVDSFLGLLEMDNQKYNKIDIFKALSTVIQTESSIFIGSNVPQIYTNQSEIEVLDFSDIEVPEDISILYDENQNQYELTQVRTPDYILFEGFNDESENLYGLDSNASEETNDGTTEHLDVYFDLQDEWEEDQTNHDDLLDLI